MLPHNARLIHKIKIIQMIFGHSKCPHTPWEKYKGWAFNSHMFEEVGRVCYQATLWEAINSRARTIAE